MIEHVVSPGDCLTSIADQYGFTWQFLWDHPDNAYLRNARHEPTILLPGDIVYVPDPRQRVEARSTEQRHRFTRHRTMVELRIRVLGAELPEDDDTESPPPDDEVDDVSYDDPVFEEQEDVPLRDVAFSVHYVLTTYGREQERTVNGTTDGDGIAIVRLPPTVREAELIVDAGTPREIRLPIRLGHLDPVDTPSGAADRLNNLGLFDGSRPTEMSPSLTAAIAAFQRAHNIAVTGLLDADTTDALRNAHGS